MPLTNKPLIEYSLDAVSNLVDERIVVVSSEAQVKNYRKFVDSDVNVLVDVENLQTPVMGALTGFEAARGEYSLLLPCDMPLVSRSVLSLLLDLCPSKSAVVPRWPNCYVEPLHAVYRTVPALEAAKSALSEGRLKMQAVVNRLRGVRYVSTLVIQQLDPQLMTFFNVNTPIDLRKAEQILNSPNTYSSSLPK
jgi:molybdopterin-guanine dinucleotide biosynthesis protein A